MSRLRRPFLYDRFVFVSVNLLGSCSAGFALKPCGSSRGAGSYCAAVALTFSQHQMRSHKCRPEGRRYACLARRAAKPRRDGRAARRGGLEGERCATSLGRGRRRTAEPVRADHGPRALARR
jgi:hypothetical protein